MWQSLSVEQNLRFNSIYTERSRLKLQIVESGQNRIIEGVKCCRARVSCDGLAVECDLLSAVDARLSLGGISNYEFTTSVTLHGKRPRSRGNFRRPLDLVTDVAS